MSRLKLTRVSVAACLVLALPAAGQTDRARDLAAIHVRDLRADLTFLTSDPLEGRLSLSPGSEVAAYFIAAEFEKAGLRSVNGDSYLQPVPVIEYLPDVKATKLVLRRGKRSNPTNS